MLTECKPLWRDNKCTYHW